MNTLTRLTLPLVVTLLAGCAVYTIKPKIPEAGKVGSEKLVSYEGGAVQAAFVGSPLVVRRAYQYRDASDAYQSDRDFTIEGGLLDARVNANGRADLAYQIGGAIKFRGQTIDAIDIPGSSLRGYMFGITADGKFSGAVAGRSVMYSPMGSTNDFKIAPPETRFLKVTRRYVLKNEPYENFELIYSGQSGDTLRLLYREFTQDDLIRPGFTQELSYPAKPQNVRFKDLEIQIIEIKPDEVLFRVVRDKDGEIRQSPGQPQRVVPSCPVA